MAKTDGNHGATQEPAKGKGRRHTRAARTRIITISAAVAVVLAGGGVGAWATVDHNSWVNQEKSYTEQVQAADGQAAASADEALADYAAAAAGLAEQVTAGEGLLAATEGQVSDEEVRQGLRDALEVAVELGQVAPDLVTSPVTVGSVERGGPFAQGHLEAHTVEVATATTPSVADLAVLPRHVVNI